MARAPVQPGVAVERARPGGGVALTEDERHWDHLARMARVFANTALVPKEMQGNEAVVMSALLYCDALGIDPRTNLGAIDLIEGKLEPRAQVYVATAAAHGWESRWGRLVRDPDTGGIVGVIGEEPSDERAELLIRPYGTADQAWQSFSFTINQARTAGLLDRWVEKKVADGQWPDGNTRYKTERFVIDRPDVEIPDWAAKEIKEGRVKRQENWWRYPADMLAARAAKRAVKRAAPQVMFGATPAAVPAEFAAAVVEHLPTDDDGEILEGELVGESAGAAADPRAFPPRTEDPPPQHRRVPGGGRDEVQASDLERTLVRSLIGTLTPYQRADLRDRAKLAAIPNINGAQLTPDHVVLLFDLITEIQADATDKAKAEAKAEAAGSGEVPAANGGPE